jgi:hypothetical protein
MELHKRKTKQRNEKYKNNTTEWEARAVNLFNVSVEYTGYKIFKVISVTRVWLLLSKKQNFVLKLSLSRLSSPAAGIIVNIGYNGSKGEFWWSVITEIRYNRGRLYTAGIVLNLSTAFLDAEDEILQRRRKNDLLLTFRLDGSPAKEYCGNCTW